MDGQRDWRRSRQATGSDDPPKSMLYGEHEGARARSCEKSDNKTRNRLSG